MHNPPQWYCIRLTSIGSFAVNGRVACFSNGTHRVGTEVFDSDIWWKMPYNTPDEGKVPISKVECRGVARDQRRTNIEGSGQTVFYHSTTR